MDVNGDFSKRVLLHTDEIAWEDSPMNGVDRRRLDRIDNEADRVTTIVRYAPESHFSPHVHTGGEEFIVLEGVFEDDYGQWPVGSYVRNPPTSKHQPGSQDGCVILVKLSQFQPDDRTFVHIDMNKIGRVSDADRAGVQVSPLYQDAHENVRLEHWAANIEVTVDTIGGAELFVLEGSFSESGDVCGKHSWLRVPVDATVVAKTSEQGAKVWVKSGHLALPVNG